MSPFRPAEVTVRGVLVVDASPDDTFPLFSPEGERLWVPGWDPEWLVPPDGGWVQGQVFRTRDDAGESVWVVARLDRESREVTYHRVTAGRSLAIIEVACRPDERRRTLVEVRYRWVGLSEAGNREIVEVDERSFATRMERWAGWIRDRRRTGRLQGLRRGRDLVGPPLHPAQGGEERVIVQVVTHHLELTDPGELRPGRPSPGLEIRRARVPCPELSRFLYTAVGGGWHWVDRLDWSYERWLAWLDRSEVETWVAYAEDTPAGYFELEEQPEGSVEIVYLGLIPRFVGRGFGGALLTAAARRGWERGARRVWVHTCSLDHPGALGNYLARGFRLFREETAEREIAAVPPGPWPGAV